MDATLACLALLHFKRITRNEPHLFLLLKLPARFQRASPDWHWRRRRTLCATGGGRGGAVAPRVTEDEHDVALHD